MQALKHYSIALLLAGMALVAGSCVPLMQIINAGTKAAPGIALSPYGKPATLTLSEPLTSTPRIRIEPALGTARQTLDYTLSISGGAAGDVLRERNRATLAPVEGGRVASLELRFPEVTLPAGRWSIRFQTAPPGAIEAAELWLWSASPGLVPNLVTALSLALLGWLAASLGALHWIRSHAARPVAAPPASEDHNRERIWTVGCHLSALLGYVLPFGHLIGPAAIWWSKRRSLPGMEQTGRNVLNFQLSVTLYVLVGLFLSLFLIGVVVLFALVVFHFTAVLLASLRAQRGLAVSYPLVMRLL